MAHSLEAIFQFLFKYRPAVFTKGDLAFGVPPSVMLLLLAAALLGIPAVLSYALVRGKSTRRDRMVLGGLRVAALLTLLACLFRPMLLLSAAVPQRNYVGVLIDDSRSMQIADRDGKPRSDFVERQFASADSGLLKALRQRFLVKLFRFSSTTEPIVQASEASYSAPETRLGDAIEQGRQALESVPLSGLVVLSDGADNSHAPLTDELLSLRARSVPVFAVGLGAEHFAKDIEVQRVEATHSVLQGSALMADVLIRQRGYGHQRVPLIVEDAGSIVASDSITLPDDGDVAPVRVHVTARTPGVRLLTFRIPVQPGEQVSQNNAQQALVEVRGRREKILYIEGEPRYEMRFIRAAVAADSNLQLVVLQRTADKKFLRLDVDGPNELSDGFPKTRSELFRYKAVVIGSIEASFFTADQLSMLGDFVSIRGGGILFLGGRRSFAEGGYAGTPLADVMPVVIQGEGVSDSLTFFADLKAQLTPAGASHAVTQLEPTLSKSEARWRALPAVSTVNRIAKIKPGAVTLIEGITPADGRAGGPGETLRGYQQPLLVYQHFGRGLSVALPIQDSWQWQMDANTPVDDPTYATFWRQLLRWLTSDVPGRVVASVATDQVNPKTAVAIRALVADSNFIARNDARVVAHIVSDSAPPRDVTLDWAVDRDGEYRGSFTPDRTGLYTIEVQATMPSGAIVRDTTYARAADLSTEYFDAEMRAPLLKRIARETGGKFYTPETVASLPEDIAMTKRGVTVVNQMDLWDMPVILLLLVGLLSAEWAYRKARGLA